MSLFAQFFTLASGVFLASENARGSHRLYEQAHTLVALDAMDRAEFAESFDLTLYDACRAKYGAEGAYPHVYDKTAPEVDVWGALAAEKADYARECAAAGQKKKKNKKKGD